ncbi:MAG TPA: hypothetical protein ENJ32_00005 [Crenotrichaceae bacterium]|nr:hypothetical protein [Crenotrichaceae bacterium]
MLSPVSYFKAKFHQYRKHLIVVGLLYGVVWSIILFFTWPDAPEYLAWFDLVSGVILIYLAYQVAKEQYHFINSNMFFLILELASLVYAIIWTFVIMIVFELDIGELQLPFDAISLYALILMLNKVWKGDATPI